MRLASIVDNADGFGTAMQAISATRYRGQRIRLSGALRGASVADGAGLWLRIDGPRGTQAIDNMDDRALRGTTDWTEANVVLDVYDDADTIAFGVLLRGTGSVDVRDVRFDNVTADIPTTGQWFEEPINLDFSE
jgi:hypothetical protein